MKTAIIKYGIANKSFESIYIDDAINGLACSCICAECKQQLIAVQGKLKKREWHFRHYVENDCTGGLETAVHQYAKQIIISNTQICIPVHGKISYVNPIAEKELLSKRPDVTAEYEGFNIYFEIVVTNFVEPNKMDFYIQGKHRSIQIDLSEVGPDIKPTQLTEIVLEQISNKSIIYWDQESNEVINELSKLENKKTDQPSVWTNFINFCKDNPIIVILIAIIGFKFLTRKNRL